MLLVKLGSFSQPPRQTHCVDQLAQQCLINFALLDILEYRPHPDVVQLAFFVRRMLPCNIRGNVPIINFMVTFILVFAIKNSLAFIHLGQYFF